jgi:predicted lipid carrier protein YhbT
MMILSGDSREHIAAVDEPLPVPLWPLALLLRGVPDAVHEAALSRVLSRVLRARAEGLQPLEGRRVTIVVSDTGNRLRFRVRAGRVERDPTPAQADTERDVLIQGRLLDFVRLAARTEDPDTLFFARRLSLEGDTETGLYIKNLLDALEIDWRGPLYRFLGRSGGERATALVERSGVEAILRGLVERALK